MNVTMRFWKKVFKNGLLRCDFKRCGVSISKVESEDNIYLEESNVLPPSPREKCHPFPSFPFLLRSFLTPKIE